MLQSSHKVFKARRRYFSGRCASPGRAIAFLIRREQRELRNRKNLPAHIKHTAVHYAVVIRKNPQLAQFGRHPFQIARLITRLYANKYQHSVIYRSNHLPGHLNFRFAHSLQQDSHLFSLFHANLRLVKNGIFQ